MNQTEFPRGRQQDIIVQQLGRETLVYDESRHMAFCLNETSFIVFRLADGVHSVAEIRSAASAEFGMQASEEFVIFALEQLRRDGLIEPPSAPIPRISRRAMVQKLGVGGALLLPAISAIVAPTAAQAYSGCVDCSVAGPRRRRPTGSGQP